ncbi:MAG: hypothetical protein JSS14_24430 [Proteobacteria bacterium]|nr:hypothetical protein [Pseudomonadota bacterium]
MKRFKPWWGARLAALAMLLCMPLESALGGGMNGPPSFDGVLFGSSATPADLASMPQRFTCRPQDPAGRYQICVPVVSTDDNNTSVMLLDGRVEGILRSFTPDEADAATLWAIAALGRPTLREMKDGQLRLQWKEYDSALVLLVTQVREMNLNGGLLILSATLERYQDELPSTENAVPAITHPSGMNPDRCLAMPYLCPNA